jgi:hypothetical protein
MPTADFCLTTRDFEDKEVSAGIEMWSLVIEKDTVAMERRWWTQKVRQEKLYMTDVQLHVLLAMWTAFVNRKA